MIDDVSGLPENVTPGQPGHSDAHDKIHHAVKQLANEVNGRLSEEILDTTYGPESVQVIAEPRRSIHLSDYPNWASAISAVNERNGVILTVRPGSYEITPERITSSQVTIEAENATLILAPGSNTSLLRVAPEAMNIDFIGGRWDGNKANQTGGHGIQFEEYTGPFRVADRSNLVRAEILNAKEDAIRIEPKRIEIKIRDTQIRDAGRYGWYAGSTDCSFQGGAIGICQVGAYINGHANWLIGSGLYTSSTAAVRLTENSRYTYVLNNMIDHNTQVGLLIQGLAADTMDAIVQGNIFRANSTSGAGLAPDIRIAQARAVTFIGNRTAKQQGSPLTSYAIEALAGVSDITDIGNGWEPTAHSVGIYSNQQPLTGGLLAGAVAQLGYSSRLPGDAYNRFQVQSGGVMQWGGGSGVTDCALYRESTNLLGTGQQLFAQRLQVRGVNGAGYIEYQNSQATAPSAPASGVREYYRTTGGKLEKVVVLADGSTFVIWTQP